jgi:hypothetical protein
MKRCILAVVVVLIASSCAWAAPLDSGHPLSLVQNASVQKELAMTAAQVTAVAPLLAAAVDEAKAKDAIATLAKTLDKDRLARLTEISYQARGGLALTDPNVTANVGLSPTQTRKLADLARDREVDLKMVLQVTRFRNAEAMRKFVLDWRKGAEKAMLAELTAGQKKAFEKMQGKKFDTSGIVK